MLSATINRPRVQVIKKDVATREQARQSESFLIFALIFCHAVCFVVVVLMPVVSCGVLSRPSSPCCIVAAVGDGMSHTTGVSGRFFEAMGSASINVLAIAQVHTEIRP